MEWPCSGQIKKYLRGSDLLIKKKIKKCSLTFDEKSFHCKVYIVAIMYECCLLNESLYKNLFSITFKYSCNVKKYPRGSDLPISR